MSCELTNVSGRALMVKNVMEAPEERQDKRQHDTCKGDMSGVLREKERVGTADSGAAFSRVLPRRQRMWKEWRQQAGDHKRTSGPRGCRSNLKGCEETIRKGQP